jgi:4-hydroxybenzoate polyprenyltransferase
VTITSRSAPTDILATQDRPTGHGTLSPATVLAVLRPWYWPVSLGPAMLGSVLGSGSWLPPAGLAGQHVGAALVLGPLVWGAVLAMNDRHDLASDRANPRKATAPAVTGAVGVRDLRYLQALFVAASLAVATISDAQLAIGTAGVLTLGWAYSAPPLRLKSRPGADVAVNAVVVGLMAPLAGWSLHQPVLAYPPALAVAGMLIAAALYVPTTVIDEAADRQGGDVTFAVRFGPRAAHRVASAMWGTATIVWLTACAQGLVPSRQVPFHVVCCALLLTMYVVLMRRPSIPRLAFVFLAFGVPAMAFLSAVVGGHPAASVLAP